MGVQYGKLTFIAGTGGVEGRRVVKLASGRVVTQAAEADVGAKIIGVTEYDAEENQVVAVRLFEEAGIFQGVASGAIVDNEYVLLTDDGKLIGEAAAPAATYQKIGISLMAAVDGEVFEFVPHDYDNTIVIS